MKRQLIIGGKLFALSCIYLNVANAAFAEEAQLMGEVVVTATKTAKDTMDAPATVSVVTTKEIENKNIHSIDESLSTLPGVYTTRPGGHEPSVMGTNVVMRGIPDYSRTLVVVDGQTLNDPYIGAVTWESVPAETVKRIEVVPGPFSSLYGGSAMGGVINIITKTPTKREFSVRGGYGMDNFASGTLVYQDRVGESVGVVFDYAYKRSDGYIKDEVVIVPGVGAGTAVTGARLSANASGQTAYIVGNKGANPWSSQNIGLKMYMDLPSESRLTLGVSQFVYDSFGRNQFNTYLSNAATGAPVSFGNVTVGAGGPRLAVGSKLLTGPDSRIKQQDRYMAEYETRLGNGTLKANLGYTNIPMYNNYIVPAATATLNGGTATRMLRPSNELSGSVQATFPVASSHLLVTGLSASKRTIDTITYNIADWRNASAVGPVQNRTGGEDNTYALYLQDEITLGERLMAYIGGRYDLWSTSGFIQQVAAPGAYLNTYATRSQTHFSPKASLVYRPAETTTLRGSVGNAFHAPNLRDTFGWWTPMTGYTYMPNPDLKPETVTSWELGAEQKVGSGTLLRATYYENSLKDLIYRTQNDILMTQGVANAGAAKVRGIELEVRQSLQGGLTAYANLTYNDSKFTSNPAKPATEGKRMTNTPQKMANLGLQGSRGPWNCSLDGHYVGKVYTSDVNADTLSGVWGSYDPYFVADAKIAYQMKDSVGLSLSVNNLLGRRYYQSSLAQGTRLYGEVSLRF